MLARVENKQERTVKISLGKAIVVLAGVGFVWAMFSAKPMTAEQQRAADIERLAKACWKVVKPGLKDPSSGELTNWGLAGNVITVKYRAKNALGAIVPGEHQCSVPDNVLAEIGKGTIER